MRLRELTNKEKDQFLVDLGKKVNVLFPNNNASYAEQGEAFLLLAEILNDAGKIAYKIFSN